MSRPCALLITGILWLNITAAVDWNSVSAARSKPNAPSSQQAKSLSLSQIESLIKITTPDNAVGVEIRRRGIDFQPTESTITNLRALGAGEKTVQALRFLMNRPTTTRALGGAVESELDKWLRPRGYVLYEPLGINLPPASVFIVKGSSTELVMASVDVLPNSEDLIQSSKIPQSIQLSKIDLTETSQLPFLPEVDVTALTTLGAKAATVHLSDIRTDVLPLSRLQDAIKNHPKLKEKVKGESQDLLIVYEALRAMQIRLTLFDSSGAVWGSNVNPQSLRAALGDNFETNPGGANILRGQVSLGIKSAGLSSVSTVLGGGGEELRLKAIPAESLRPLFIGSVDAPSSFSSGYQVFGLVIAQGNYSGISERVGGTLTGAVASAEIVVGNLKSLLQGRNENNVQMVVSREGLVNFDKSNPLKKAELTEAIATFSRQVREKADPAKQSVVFFYYFGHGVADEKLHTIYLVPEDFKDRPDKPVIELEDGLISVEWVRDQLLKASDNILLLIDACRKIEGPDELDRLRANWGSIQIKPPVPVNETLDIIKFMSGLYGPSPMLFGSEDGTNAPVVPATVNDTIEEIGPISRRLQLLFESLAKQNGTLTISDFIVRMGEQVDITLADGKKLKAYTALRKDFLEELPQAPLISTSPQQLASRARPFTSTGPKTTSAIERETVAKSVVPKTLNKSPLKNLLDFVYLPERKSFYLLDDQSNILQWAVDERQPVLVREDKDFSLPVIGAAAAGLLYLCLSDSHDLFVYDNSNRPELIRGEIYLGFFGRGYRERSVILVEQDATVGTKDSVYRLDGKRVELLASFDTTNAFDLVEWKPGKLYYTDPGRGVIYTWQGESSAFKTGLERPAMLSSTEDFLYCLSQSRKLLYRFDVKGNGYKLSLPSVEMEATTPNLNLRGFRAISDSTFYVASGPNILQLDVEDSDWQAVR